MGGGLVDDEGNPKFPMQKTGADDAPSDHELHRAETILANAKSVKPLLRIRKKVIQSMVDSRVQTFAENAQSALHRLSQSSAGIVGHSGVENLSTASQSVNLLRNGFDSATGTVHSLAAALFAMVRALTIIQPFCHLIRLITDI